MNNKEFVKSLRVIRRKLKAKIRRYDEFDTLMIEKYTYKVELLNCMIAEFGGHYYNNTI